jgi:hypothetical protein
VNQKTLRTTSFVPRRSSQLRTWSGLSSITAMHWASRSGWLYPGGDIGAVSRDNVAIFFRRRTRPFEPSRKGPGVCVSSRWKTSMEIASIFTATEQVSNREHR